MLRGSVQSNESKRKISKALKGNKIMIGKKRSEETKLKISKTLSGRKLSKETRKKMSESRKGEKCYLWKGGVTPLRIKIQNSNRYKIWRKKVFERDNYICQVCRNKSGGDINAHHIKSFWEYPERRFWVSNGITLCKKCHKLTDSYLKRAKEIEQTEQINLFTNVIKDEE